MKKMLKRILMEMKYEIRAVRTELHPTCQREIVVLLISSFANEGHLRCIKNLKSSITKLIHFHEETFKIHKNFLIIDAHQVSIMRWSIFAEF